MSDKLRTVFLPAILHGDTEHRAWLTAAVDAFIEGSPIPPPRGQGQKEAEIKALRAERDALRQEGFNAGIEAAAKVADRWDNITRPSDERQVAREISAAIRTKALGNLKGQSHD